MTKTEIIGKVIEFFDFKDYLEIGVSAGVNINSIRSRFPELNVSGVDPRKVRSATHIMTSDEFFDSRGEDDEFDVIFIDGLHTGDQVHTDILNSLAALRPGGWILCHDMSPRSREAAEDPNRNGDSWKGFVRARLEIPHFKYATVNCDQGVGIITDSKHGPQSHPLLHSQIPDELDYSHLDDNRKEWLNLITPNEFKRLFS